MSAETETQVPSKELAYFFPDTQEREIVNHLDLNILVTGVAEAKNDLEQIHPFRADPFYRIYYATAGEVELIYASGSFTLRSGYVYLMPASQPFRYISKSGFSHYWLHFCSSHLEKIPHFQNLLELPAPKETERLMQDFLRLAEAGKGIKNLMEADIILRRLLIPFLETMPEGDYEQVNRLYRFSLVIKYIDRHIAEDLTVPYLASMLRMNRNDFSAEFHRAFGIPPKQYICQRRIGRAKVLLLSSTLSIKQIGEQVGYDNEFFFYRLFRKYSGVTPSWFRHNSNLGI